MNVFDRIFEAQLTLAMAVRHLSNRASAAPGGVLTCTGPEREAIDIMNGLHVELEKDFAAHKRVQRAKRGKKAAA